MQIYPSHFTKKSLLNSNQFSVEKKKVFNHVVGSLNFHILSKQISLQNKLGMFIHHHLSSIKRERCEGRVFRRINSIWKSGGKNVGKQTCNRHRFELSLRALLVDVVVVFFLSRFDIETLEK